MRTAFSRVVLSLIVGMSVSYADDASNLEEAFTKGELTASVGAYGQYFNKKGGTKDDGFANGFGEVGFQTAPLYGISVGLKAFGSVKLDDKNDAYDAEGAIEDNAVLSEAFIKYEHEGVGHIVLGRQEVDFNWLTDYIEGVSAELSAIENLVVNMAWARKQSVVGFDEISEKFAKMNDNDGIYMLEAVYTPIEMLELNPYIYYGDNVFTAYGAKATLNFELSDALKTSTMLHYAKVNSDATTEEDDGLGGTVNVKVEDGSFMQVEQGFEFSGVSLALGYMKTDKDGLAGLESFGDQSPLEEGNHVFDANAKTPYASISYEIEGVKLGALYAQSKYDDGISSSVKEKELDVSVGYEIIKNLEASLIYVNVDNDTKADSYNALKALVKYTF
ncbi:Opr family porin [Sulfurospirillum barnesii]|uniref:Putative outer membrane protein n=1 Tax=Sulfurospirillum barnesii (strain ATCC 700032 / DSM 10660 / SES-3) TaxID=760154 RepID=I3XY70_SULBS|nr:Opr family porin [Sulfurospirillum barnesii]AFL68894.1 Putative outer membrane protein [Sulfurospirillum barnesii SES-3]